MSLRSSDTTSQTIGGAYADRSVGAVLFRTHFWDDFVSRQFARLLTHTRGLDVFLLVDETRGFVDTPKGIAKFSVTDQQILEAGFVNAGGGSIQWFSGDVPLYLFKLSHPAYSFYVQLEYDVVVNVGLAQLVERLINDQVDLLLLSNEEPDRPWHWQQTMLAAYNSSEIRHQLFCFSIFSNSAITRLYEARLQQAGMFRSHELSEWPYCEGYIATEGRRQKLKCAELSDYVSVPNYKWWPPYLESGDKLSTLGDIVHPVLDQARYVSSLLKHDIAVKSLFLPLSWFNKKLLHLGLRGFFNVVLSSDYRKRVKASLDSRYRKLVDHSYKRASSS